MVKIRLRRTGTKARPFYRVVVAKSSAGRNGSFIENIGLYNPVVQPKLIKINSERALHWLRQGAQPTETTAIILSKAGVLDTFFGERPSAKKKYAFLDKRTSVTSKKSVIEAPVAEAKPEPAPVAVAEAPAATEEAEVTVENVADAVVEETTEVSTEEEAPAE